MTTSRDDMVLRPRINLGNLSVRERAQEERYIRSALHRQGRFGRWLRHRATARVASSGALRAARGLRIAAMESEGIAARGVAGGAARAAGRTPVGLIVAAIAVSVAVVARLASGRSFENMGAQISKMIFGDLDEKGLAGQDARRRLSSNEDLARMVQQQGGPSAEMLELYKSYYRTALMKRIGDAKLGEDQRMQVNGLFDMVILRLRNAVVDAWRSSGGEEIVQQITEKMLIRKLTRYR